jgi:hypothetical protein
MAIPDDERAATQRPLRRRDTRPTRRSRRLLPVQGID